MNKARGGHATGVTHLFWQNPAFMSLPRPLTSKQRSTPHGSQNQDRPQVFTKTNGCKLWFSLKLTWGTGLILVVLCFINILFNIILLQYENNIIFFNSLLLQNNKQYKKYNAYPLWFWWKQQQKYKTYTVAYPKMGSWGRPPPGIVGKIVSVGKFSSLLVFLIDINYWIIGKFTPPSL